MEPAVVLITDSCVLIDYCRAGPDALRTMASTVRVVVPDVLVADELDDIGEAALLDLGVEVIAVPTELLTDAVSRPRPLSFYDWTCLLLARSEGWTCVTNDARLVRQCRSSGVAVRWGLEPLLDMAKSGLCSRDRAVAIVEAMAADNPRLTDAIKQDFRNKVSR